METKKRLGTYFRENENQLDLVPSETVWKNIENDLDKKKKKRRIFIIWFFGLGFLLMGTGIYLTFSNQELQNENAINEKDSKTNSSSVKQSITNATNTAAKSIQPQNVGYKKASQSQIATISNQLKRERIQSKLTLNDKHKKASTKNSITLATHIENQSKINTTNKGNDRIYGEVTYNKEDNPNSANNQTLTTKERNIASIDTSEHKIETPLSESKNKATKNPETKLNDSITDPKKEPIEATTISFTPYFGYVTSGYLGNFNSISNNTVSDKENKFRTTYGIVARWKFNQKIGLQLGIGKLNSRYAFSIENNSGSFLNTTNLDLAMPSQEIYSLFSASDKITLIYESSFYEIPLEGYYQVIDNKIGIATSLGFSYLIANENKIFAQSETISQRYLGNLKTEARSSITGNFKLYVSYKLSPQLHFDVNPEIQFRFFGNTDKVDYSTYFLSLKTGITYSF